MKNRQLELLVYLLKYKKATYKTLAKYFEVSTKTIERDINFLSSAGFPVYCQPGGGGGVFIDTKYTFSTSYFSLENISHIITSLHIAKSFTANPQNAEIIQKLSLIAPDSTHHFEKNVEHYFSIDIYKEAVRFDQGIFLDVNRCLDLRLCAKMDEREKVIPLGYVYRPDGLYLFFYDNGYDLIKISEICRFVVLQISYEGTYHSYNSLKKINHTN